MAVEKAAHAHGSQRDAGNFKGMRKNGDSTGGTITRGAALSNDLRQRPLQRHAAKGDA